MCRLMLTNTSVCVIDYPEMDCSGSRDVFTFWELSDNNQGRPEGAG